MIFEIQPKQHFGSDTHAYWEDFLTEEDINKILSLPQWNNLNIAKIGNSIPEGNIDNNLRRTEVSWMPVNQDTLNIWTKISNAVSEINRRFFNFNLTGFYEQAQLGIYKSDYKGHYDWHVDASPSDFNVPRKLSMVLSLSERDEFEGGELHIKPNSDKEINLEIKKGRAWFFPSYTLHRVTPVTKGIRKSLVLWVGGPAFR